ncbi:Nonribosomal peptide synthetase [Pedobacter cryoconitis]|uniref:Nonribosomal peptide synthetase n=1 Tax=Pedobacter cryoconitis TaxID=188932 RepID=A0A127VEG4_9SPHI|nr:non-ribosomal peptide synthetase [Pedobacter cryoconitis]AMP99732.1 Nonribosomal peptide synthetase [Pedobacter cryoconitis]
MKDIKSIMTALRKLNVNLSLTNGVLEITSHEVKMPQDLLESIELHQEKLVAYLKKNLISRDFNHILPVENGANYALSSSQRRLWIQSKFNTESVAYNMSSAYVFEETFSRDAIEYAFTALIERHEILRTVIREDESGEVRQFIQLPESSGFKLSFYDLCQDQDAEDRAKELVSLDFSRNFDLEKGPLIRAGLYQISEQRWIFSFVMHHIISDGWSMGILIRELLQLYHSYLNGLGNPLVPLRIQYKDYAAWQQEQLNGTSLEGHRSYWLEQLSGELPVLDLEGDQKRKSVRSYAGGVANRTLSKDDAAGIKGLSQGENGTLFMGLLAALNTLLYKYTQQTEMIIGSPIAGREHADLEGQIGFYLNMLALRGRFKGEDSYLSLLRHFREVTLGAYEHQVYPFDELVGSLNIAHDQSRNALFDVLIDFHDNRNAGGQELNNLKVSSFTGGEHVVSKFDLTFMFMESDQELSLSIEYNSDLYSRAYVERMHDHFAQLLSAIVANPDLPVQELNYISKAEENVLLNSFNANFDSGETYRSVLSLFEEQVSINAGDMALSYDGLTLSYHELAAKSNQLAHYLKEEYKLQQGDMVGIMQERSDKLLISILGILKAGGVYVPIDPDYPQSRKEYILEDTGLQILLTQTSYMFDLSYYEGNVFAVDIQLDELGTSAAPVVDEIAEEDMAYIIYTSGSTGQQKGCCVSHGSLANYIQWANSYYFDGTVKGNFGLFTSLSFDLTVTSIFCALTGGGSLYIYNQEKSLSDIFTHTLSLESGIDSIKLTPSHIRYLKDLNLSSESLKCAIVGGEEVVSKHVEILKQINPGMRVYNEYGPTETTVGCTVQELEAGEAVHIGRPISGAAAYVLDENLRLCAIGVSGELCISGAGVSLGYLNKEPLSREKFVADPYRLGQRLYRTGDTGRWASDGTLIFLGRKDDQVKIRGYRIELGEIEQALLRHPDIDSSAVVVKAGGDGDHELIAYLTGSEPLLIGEIRTYLHRVLPAYMIPSLFVQLDSMPLTINGKIDRKQLPDPGKGMNSGTVYVAPVNETEEQLVNIWSEVLGIDKDQIGTKSDFFELGAHSLKAIRLTSQIYKEFDVKIDLKDVFVTKTLEGQAELILKAKKVAYINILPVENGANYALSSSQRRLWIQSKFNTESVAYNMSSAYVFEETFSRDAIEYAFTALIERHEILRTVIREDESGEVRQFIQLPESSGFKLSFYDLCQDQDAEDRAKELVSLDFSRNFDLEKGPLIRAGLYQISEQRWIFSFVMHHIISDGWSMGILIRELLQLYHSYLNGLGNPLVPLRIQYKDYAAWQQEQLNGTSLEGHRSYWLEQLSGELPVLDLEGDQKRKSVRSYAGGVANRTLSKDDAAGIKGLSQGENGTLFMGLLAALNTLLYKYTQQTEMIIGSPIAGREHADLEGQIGFYLNMLALRGRFKGEDSYLSLLRHFREVTLGAYEHQVYPFDELVGSLNIAHDQSRNALFDVLIDFHDNRNAGGQELNNLKVSSFTGGEHVVSKFDLTFMFMESDQELSLSIEYNSDLYSRAYVERMHDHFAQLLSAIVANPDLPVQELNYISKAEENVLLNSFNANFDSGETYRSVLSLFEEQVSINAGDMALSYDGLTLSYHELAAKSNQLAHYLKEEYKLQQGDMVGIMQERSDKLLISILGILKAGGVYVPIDPDYPQSRKEYILEDTGLQILLTQTSYMFDLSYYEGNVFAVDIQLDELGTSAAPVVDEIAEEDMAYIIYTSGSTGQQKGCCVSHGSLANYIQWANSYYFDGTVKGNFGLFTSLSFDLTVTSIFCALTGGGSLYIYNQEKSLSDIFTHTLSLESGIDSIKLTPSHIRYLKDLNLSSESLKCAIVGGEEVVSKHVEILKQINPGMRVYNEYGPTETTVGCTVQELEAGEAVHIGRPISGAAAYVLDENLRLCAIGVSGELCISGAGVSLGYLNKEPLSREKFVADPYRLGQRLYRTGDTGRWASDGTLIFLGRKDDQVKIRGYRIELGEIEQALLRHPDIDSSAVVVKAGGDGDHELIAYLTGSEPLLIGEIRTYLHRVLPAYMIPSLFVQLDSMPLTINGKIDRKQLPDPGKGMNSGTVYVAPVNETERALVEVYEEVLKKEYIGMKDDFFALGGDSIKSIQIISRLRKKGYSVSIQDILLLPVLDDLKEKIKLVTRKIDQDIIEGEILLSPIQQYFFGNSSEDAHHYNQSVLLESKDEISEEGIKKVFDKIVHHHDALRMVYQNTSNGWKQMNKGIDQGYVFEIIDNYTESSFIEECERIQSTLDLEKGPLFKVCLFRKPGEHRLLILAHHLIIDGVSWRIIFEDLSSLYQQYLSGEPLVIPLKSDSFKYWMEKQEEYKTHTDLLNEEPFWTAIGVTKTDPLPLDHPLGTNLRSDAVIKSFNVNQELTKKLLTQCHHAYQTDTNDILLAVLSLSIKEIFSLDKIVINLEGHGRESIGNEVDVSRTVGWFTTMYPVVLEINNDEDLIKHLVTSKEVLHRVPNKGIGFGILRYLAGKQYEIDPQINFNYLGDFGTGIENAEGSRLFDFVGEYHGMESSGNRRRDSILNVSGIIVDSKISILIEFSNKQFDDATIEDLLQSFQRRLENFIVLLSEEDKTTLSPVDLTYKGLNQAQLEELSRS